MAGSDFKLGKVGYSKQDITSAAGTTVLLNNSDKIQYITGSTTQNVQLPDATTMVPALGFVIANANSVGAVTVKDNGSNVLLVLVPGTTAEFILDSISTSNGTWMIMQGASSASGPKVFFTATAGQNLSVNDAVYVCSSTDDGSRTVGNVYKLDVTTALRTKFAGFAITTTTSGNSVTVQLVGEMTGFSGIPVGLRVWASLTTPGSFQTTIPTTSSPIVPLGVGSTATTKLLINGALFATNSGIIPLIQSIYFAGGGPGSLSSTDKLAVPAETISAVSSTIPSGNNDGAGVVGSDRGYLLGTTTRQNVVDKLVFSTDTWSSLGAILGSGIQGAIPCQSATKGYCLGGDNGSTTNAIDSVIFSSDTRQSVSATLPTAIRATAGVTFGTTAGYSLGDNSGPSNIIQKLVFSGETTSTIAATISTTTGAATGNYSPTAGYREGGASGGTVIDKLLFSTQARTTLSATLSISYAHGLGHSSSSKGYVGGGGSTTINALVFSSDTNAAISAVLNATRDDQGSGLRH